MSSEIRLRVEPGELELETVRLEGEGHHYLTRVRRVTVASELELFDGGGRCRRVRVVAVTGEFVTLEAISPVVLAPAAAVRVTSLLPLIKGERMDVAIAKLTELGVERIVPIRCKRSVVTLTGDRAHKRVERFARIATDAARQCGRSEVPVIAPISDFGSALEHAQGSESRLCFAPGAGVGLRARLEANPRSVALLTGPEGGLAPDELEDAVSAGFEPTHLGPRILRAETAAIVVATGVMAIVGDLGG